MALIVLSKKWLITPNLRKLYTSVADAAAWWLYQNHETLKAAGWSVKYTSDGVGGPGHPNDHADRLVSEAACGTRGANTASSCSYTVLTNADGVDLCLSYVGAAAGNLRVAYSPRGLYTPAPTPTHQPLAEDETVVCGGGDVVGSDTSLDRVMSIWCSEDTRHWSCACWRNNVLLGAIGIERINSLCHEGVFDVPYVGYRYTSTARQTAVSTGAPTGGISGFAVGNAAWTGTLARIFTLAVSRITRVGGGEIGIAAANNQPPQTTPGGVWANTPPALQMGIGGGSPLLPPYWTGERAANLDGILGYPIDWWYMVTHQVTWPATGDFIPALDFGDLPNAPARTNWLVALGPAMVRPWRNAAPALETA